MKFTGTFVTIFCVAAALGTQQEPAKKTEEQKEKREAPHGYPSSGHSQSFQAPSHGHEASAISIGAGYSVGGDKSGYNYNGPDPTSLQLSSESLPASGHATIQLAPITLQGGHGEFPGNDFQQLMAHISHGLNTGAISLPSSGSHEGSYLSGIQSGHGQSYSLPQQSYGAPALQASYAAPVLQQSYGAPSLQQFSGDHGISSAPSYSAGTKGLGSYSSTGPVLFTPENQPTYTFAAPSSGHSFGSSGGLSLGGSHVGNSLSGFSLPSHGLSGHSHFGHSLGGHSFGGSTHLHGAPIKSFSGHAVPSKNSFKPSAFLGSSVQSESLHGSSGLSGLSGPYGAPSFGSHSGSLSGLSESYGAPTFSSHSGSHGSLSFAGGHGLSLGSGHGASFGGSHDSFSGSSKYPAPAYLPAKESFSSSLDSSAALSSHGHFASPPATTYGVPSGSYQPSNSHASSSSPKYYISSKHPSSGSFGGGSSSYKGSLSGHGSSSFSSGPKYSFSGTSRPSSSYGAPKDIQGSYSENSYNTIKYSEEIKPQA